MLQAIAILLFGVTGFSSFFTLYLIDAIKSFYDDGLGKSILYGNKDYLVLSISFLIILFLGIYCLYTIIKKKQMSLFILLKCFALGSVIPAIYFIGKAIKQFSSNANGSLAVIYGLIFAFLTFVFISFLVKTKQEN